MKIVIKRLVAYIIDIVLVSIVSTVITSSSYINKDYDKYINTSEEYEAFYEEYTDYIEELQEQLDDEEITKDEYDIKLKEKNEIYERKSIDYNYKLIKLSLISTIISILVILLYFVVIQYYFNGQTLGKRIMKLRVISKNDKKLNLFNYFIRSLILNSVLINILNIVFVVILSKNNYLVYNQIIYVLEYVLEMTIIAMIVLEKNNRGIHDYLANSKVIFEGEKNEV